MKCIEKEYIENYILKNFEDIYPLDTWGEKSFFLNPQQKLKRGAYFATLKEKDGQNDKASFLNREGIFRLNLGVTKDVYLSLFSFIPECPPKGGVIQVDCNFQELDVILPHPIYGWITWVSVLNPSIKTFEICKPLLENAYNKALENVIRRLQTDS